MEEEMRLRKEAERLLAGEEEGGGSGKGDHMGGLC
jgi:hypothetical protein